MLVIELIHVERRRSTSSKIATDDNMAETQDNMSTIGTEDRDHYREDEGIIDVLNPSSNLLYCADNCTGLCRLMTTIRSPGLIRAHSLERTNTTPHYLPVT